ncbi:MAG: hypothetical protein MMC33_005910 [Icmadophila ericetorum]|nr:hypothetical protein [Icmadophila ericetorum]
MTSTSEPAYIDYEAFLSPTFSPISFANTLVKSTNDASDTAIDLSTPLSKVLFDVQEIDTHIHTLTTKSALPLLNYASEQTAASQNVAKELEAQVKSLTEGYKRLELEVLGRHEAAEEVRIAVERLWQTVKIGRAVGRCMLLGRQLEAQMAEIGTGAMNSNNLKGGTHRVMVRASNTILTLRQLFAASGPGEEGEALSEVNVVQTLQRDLYAPTEQTLRSRGQQIIREFSTSSLASSTPAASGTPTTSTPTATTQQAPTAYTQTEEIKSRTTSACLTLYLLSPTPPSISNQSFTSTLLLTSLQQYLQSSLTSSLASLARALANLPTLPRTLQEVSARCQNIVYLEILLEGIHPPPHPFLPENTAPENLLAPLLSALDTTSLPSYFWRSLASNLSARVQEIINKGGVSARTLRSQKDRVRESIRDCVIRGTQGARVREGQSGDWQREVGVMVGSVMGPLGR